MNRLNFIKKTTLLSGVGLLSPSQIAFGSSSKIIGSNEKIKFGAIGLNNMGWVDSMSLLRVPNVELVAICDVDKNILEKRNYELKKSGIKVGDVILKFDGKPVPRMRKLPRIVAETEVDKPVKVLVWRDGKEITVNVTIGVLNEEKMASANPEDVKKQRETNEETVSTLGMTLGAAIPSVREKFKLDADSRGVVVIEVADDGAAFEKGVRPGDMIVEVSQQEVTTPAQVISRVNSARKKGEKRILLLLEGQSGLRFVAVSINKK